MPGRWEGKPCQRCGGRKTPKYALAKYCRPCDKIRCTEDARRAHDRYLRRTYGITIEEYEAIFALQGGTCYICRVARGITKRLSVDHDHKIGSGREAVRGLLCTRCNDNLGFYRDNPDAFQRAIDYLQSPPARQVIPRETATMEEPG